MSQPDRGSPLHRKLRALGEMQAPASIHAAVMANVRSRSHAAAGLRWWQWSKAAQGAYMTSWIAAAAFLAWAGHQLLGQWGIPLTLSEGLSISTPLDWAAPMGRAALTVWWSARVPLLAALFFSYLACAGLGTAIYRLAARTHTH